MIGPVTWSKMELKKIAVKFFVADSNNPPLTDFIDLFHGWIQATDGVYHDVADYSHMQAGPGIVLVANDANVSIDETENRRGLLYSRKQPLPGTNPQKILRTFGLALDICKRLEAESSLSKRIKFRCDETLFTVNDRLITPNDEATFLALKDDVEDAVGGLYRGSRFTLDHNKDPRQRFSIAIRASEPFDLDTLIANVGAAVQSSR
jgi:hypothetical protein